MTIRVYSGPNRAPMTRAEFDANRRWTYLLPCELHNIPWAECGSCGKFADECDHGGCYAPATHVYSTPAERRRCCERHGEAFRQYDGLAGRKPGEVIPLDQAPASA